MSAATMDLGHTGGRRRTTGRVAARRRSNYAWAGPAIWAAALLVIVVAVGMLPAHGDFVPSKASTAIQVSVAPTDTLWSIAAKHRLPGTTTAQTVEAIVAANGLEGRRVSAGTTLRVPTQGLADAALARSADTVAER